MPSIHRLSNRLISGQSVKKTPPGNIPPGWLGGGGSTSGTTYSHKRYVYSHFRSSTFRLDPGNYALYVFGGAGGWAPGGSNGSVSGGAGGLVVHAFNVASATNLTLQAGQGGGKATGTANTGRRGKGGVGYHNGGDGGGDSPAPTDDVVFEYTTAGVYTFTSPGVTGQTCTFEIFMHGGGGGAGGNDSNSGGFGGGGRTLTGTYTGPANTVFTVLVGAGGGAGASAAAGTGGGTGGTPTGVFAGTYRGGNGGNAGGSGTSGGGGGGGAATVLRHPTLGDILIAGGGAGGGGGGHIGAGARGSIFNIPTADTNGTAGQNKSGDGGGAGGGGGGFKGGTGGGLPSGDLGGFGGTPGSNFITPGASFSENIIMNGGLGAAGGAGYFRCRVFANVNPASFNWKGGGGGASSYAASTSFTIVAAGGGGAGADGQNPSFPATAGGKIGNNSAGGSAGSDGGYAGTTPAGSAGTAPGGGGGGGADEQFNDPNGGGGKGGLNTVPSGAVALVGADGTRFTEGVAPNATDENYLYIRSFVPYCANGGGYENGGNGAILVIKDPGSLPAFSNTGNGIALKGNLYMLAHANDSLTNDAYNGPGIGIYSGTPAYTTGYFNNAWNFNGSGNFVLSMSLFNWTVSNWTWEFFVYAPSIPTNPFFTHYVASDRNWQISIQTSAVLVNNIFGGTYHNFTFPSNFLANTWYHICLMRTSGTLRCFRNGTPSTVTSVDSFPQFDGGAYGYGIVIGSSWFGPGPQAYANVRIDEMRMISDAAQYPTTGFAVPTAEFVPFF